MDFSQFSDEELMALKKGDYSKLSDKSLMALKQASAPQAMQPDMIDKVGSKISDVWNSPKLANVRAGVQNAMTNPAFAPTNPLNILAQAAPSNVLNAAGVAAANAPGVASAAVNSLPGVGDPSAIPQAVANIAQNPSQVAQAASRVIQTQGGARYNSADERALGRAGTVAGSVVEAAVPGTHAADNALENAAETKAANATMQEYATERACNFEWRDSLR